ncbi:hypothetical protein TPAU25S_04448 [Tsukamurella paurometabola]
MMAPIRQMYPVSPGVTPRSTILALIEGNARLAMTLTNWKAATVHNHERRPQAARDESDEGH